jgi:hypothetical protein
MLLSGFIVGRRSIGRSLAFAEIDVTEESTEIDRSISSRKLVKVKFNRQTFQDGMCLPGECADSIINNDLDDVTTLDDPFPLQRNQAFRMVPKSSCGWESVLKSRSKMISRLIFNTMLSDGESLNTQEIWQSKLPHYKLLMPNQKDHQNNKKKL